MSPTPEQTVRHFLDGLSRLDVEDAVSVVGDAVDVRIYPLDLQGSAVADIRGALQDVVTAFPDLHVTVKTVIQTGDVVAVELKLEGTQGADYVGVTNQEKHLDLDQAWRFVVTDGRITRIDAYWCQNQLYRRLAVKRLDQVAIVGGARA